MILFATATVGTTASGGENTVRQFAHRTGPPNNSGGISNSFRQLGQEASDIIELYGMKK